MSSNARLPSHIRHASLAGNSGGSNSTSSNPSSSASASPALLARITEKKAELANLRELRDLSGQLAGQMQMLEEKLSTLAGGTEGALFRSCLRQSCGLEAYETLSECC